MRMELISACLGIMGKGMLGGFFVIWGAGGLAAQLGRITGRKR